MIVLSLAAISLAGCASAYNAKTDGDSPFGGGYYEDAIQNGVIYIQAKTNAAPLINTSGAHRLWRHRAERFCGSGDFRELGMGNWHYESVPPTLFVPHIVTVQEGFAVCANSGLSNEEAVGVIRPRCARYRNTGICAAH